MWSFIFFKSGFNVTFLEKDIFRMIFLSFSEMKVVIKMVKCPLLAHFLNINDLLKMAYLCGFDGSAVKCPLLFLFNCE